MLKTASFARKSEVRSTKSETTSNDQNANFQNKNPLHQRFGDWYFEFVSNFDIRISNFIIIAARV